MWTWSLLATVLWVALMMSQREQWADFWYQTRIWMAGPAVFLSGLLSAGAADTVRARVACDMERTIDTSPRSTGRMWLNFGISLLLIGWIPAIAGVGFGAAMSGIHLGWANPLSELVPACFAYITAMMLLGGVIGGLVLSRIGAPLLALAVGFLTSLYANPIPARGAPWLVMNPAELVFLAVITLVLCGAFALALPWVDSSSSEKRRAERRTAGASFAGLAVLACVFVTPHLAQPLPRATATDAVCEKTAIGNQVCVWPEDRAYLAPLKQQAVRWSKLQRALGQPLPNLAEPGLPAGVAKDAVTVNPVALGDGLWFTAEDMAFESYDRATTCPAGQDYSPENSNIDPAFTDIASTYIFGTPRPDQVRTVNGSGIENDEIARIVAPVIHLPPSEQEKWLVSTARKMQASCM